MTVKYTRWTTEATRGWNVCGYWYSHGVPISYLFTNSDGVWSVVKCGLKFKWICRILQIGPYSSLVYVQLQTWFFGDVPMLFLCWCSIWNWSGTHSRSIDFNQSCIWQNQYDQHQCRTVTKLFNVWNYLGIQNYCLHLFVPNYFLPAPIPTSQLYLVLSNPVILSLCLL